MTVWARQSMFFEMLKCRWQDEWQRSVFPRFFNWWITELIECAPARWRERLVSRKTVQAVWPLQAREDSPANVKLGLLVAADEVWPCELELPKQTARNLRSVVSYELDKHTPFTNDQVYFDVKARSSQQSGLLQVLLVVIDRPRLDRIIGEATALGIEVTGVDAFDGSGQPLGLNLMPCDTGSTAHKKLRRIRYALWATIVLLLIAIPATLISKREQRLEEMRVELAQLRGQAMEVDGMRKKLLVREETEKALGLQSSHHQTTLTLLENLTACVTKDTWLDHLEIRSDLVVNLTGMSRTASELPSLLMSCANLHKAAFQGGVQPDGESGMDRFSITAVRRVEPGK